ncbi:MAG TPA: SAM-dependent methyltransferase [Pyrinomonadaceae bacterium]|jgi:methyltransferase (TIGR00027 family)|nr:SAM-dependent methyltransferase [Pyrinomonadaceae bacterium]
MTPASLEEKDRDKLKPISKTAFYCCGIRMRDAESARPVCGDSYARLFMNDEGLRILAAFDDEERPNAGNVARARIVDDILRRELAADTSLRVVIIGAGFDSRAYRLKGGRWAEFDEPQVIAYKEERLPASKCENELRRVPVDFATESLEEKLAPFASESRVVVVLEGVLMYLEEGAIRELLGTLRRVFPRQLLVCDLLNRRFFEKYGKKIHRKVADLGAAFKFVVEDPERVFVESGYRRAEKISIVGKSVEYQGGSAVMRLLLKTLLRTVATGYSIYVFETS